MFQLLVIFAISAVFLLIERVRPGRELPHSKNWYVRSIALNACQLGFVFIAGATWNQWFRGASLFHVGGQMSPLLEGFLYWFLGTFVFYWWHRLRHQNGWWHVFHQIHHSPTRVEVLTSFYKHPVEMMANSILISAIIFIVFGGSVEAAAWYNVYAVFGELFYHANIRTPRWVGYFIQRPEHHSIHHETGVHNYNFGDITLWDRLFGTFKDTDQFAPRCGFHEERERYLSKMLRFTDVQ